MALIYDDIAILSVGMSCQTAWRLYEAQGLIDGLVGTPGLRHGTPFDWTIARPVAVRRALELGRFRPDSPDDLRPRAGRFYWPETGIWYWHEHRAQAEFDSFAAKFDRLTATLEHLRTKRVLALWSNGQADLVFPSRRFPSTAPTIGGADLVHLARALDAFFPNCRLFPVVAPHRIAPDRPLRRPPPATYDADDPEQDWQGDPQVWNPILAQAVTAHLDNRPIQVS
ncbi:MAG: hypothetical protein CML66_13200 [Rhodobacteraceae bacterium]|nr:hypothetical protein [Paracoccaceae bacterium]QEW21251.1 hypothetical protein LA6_003459 [Marinibacterium anthonyi]